MAIIPFLQGKGATHLFTLNNEGNQALHNLGDSSDPTYISGGQYQFTTVPACVGVTHSCETKVWPSSYSAIFHDGAVFLSKEGINITPLPWATGNRTLMLWASQQDIQNPTCIYEQGAASNNFAFIGGAQTSFQCARSGDDLLIVSGKQLAKADRPYLLVGVWEHHTQHAGSGNRVIFYINGVEQGTSELTSTSEFPSHSGDITLGNTSEALASYADSTLSFQSTYKNLNYLGMFDNVSFSETESREIFERMVLPEVLISSDTVANQQAALDALSGNTYEDVNCAIEIRQATDATDYTLTLNNITFVKNDDLRDIAVQYVGPNHLTIINSVSNAEEVSTPVEKDLDGGTTIVTGGGTISIVTPSVFTVTGLQANSEVRIYTAGTATELAGIENSSTSFASVVEAPSVDIVIHHLDYQYLRISNVVISGDTTLPVQQVFDRNYHNA